MATKGALVDIAVGHLSMRIYDKVEAFKVYEALKLPTVYEDLAAITMIDTQVAANKVKAKDPLAKMLNQEVEGDIESMR